MQYVVTQRSSRSVGKENKKAGTLRKVWPLLGRCERTWLRPTDSEVHKLWELPIVTAITIWGKLGYWNTNPFLTVPTRKETFQPPSNHPVSMSFCLSKEASRWICGLWAVTVATTSPLCVFHTCCLPDVLLRSLCVLTRLALIATDGKDTISNIHFYKGEN